MKKIKTIENKKILIASKPANYFSLLLRCLNNIPPTGLSVLEMRLRICICDELSKKLMAKEIQMEEKNFNYVKAVVSKTKWNIISKEIIDFTDYIMNIK